MKLTDLLQELRNNILHDRTDRFEGSSDYLWTDETLVRYINEAHRRFARRSFVIRDQNNPSVTRITLQTGVTEYPLHPSIFGVLSARYTGDTADLARTGHATLDTYRMPDSLFFDPSMLAYIAPGKTVAFATDEGIAADSNGSMSRMVFRAFPAPAAAQNNVAINLRVVRVPLQPFDVANLNAVPEIPEDHHLEMLDWAAYLALRVEDVEAGSQARADKFASSFETHVAVARNNVMRKLFAPAAFSFGRNAFSWEK